MGRLKHGIHFSVRWRVILSVIILFVMTLVLSSCGKETDFPADPNAHRLLKEMEKWPDDYYWLVETGVASRVMGIRVKGDSIKESLKRLDKLVSKVKAEWSNIEELDTAEKLINYFRGNDLVPIAKAIEETLSKNRALEPAGEFHAQLQAMAIKRGLIAANREVQKELSG